MVATGAEVRGGARTTVVASEWLLGDHKLCVASCGLTAAGCAEARRLGIEEGPALLLADGLREEHAASFDNVFSLGERFVDSDVPEEEARPP